VLFAAYLDNCKLSGVPSGIANAAQLQRWSFQFTYYLIQVPRLSGICNAALNIIEFAIQ
jgi:hypothetical protein